MSLARAIATVGSFTLLSRLVGFVRDIVLSAVLGSGAVADAFFVAFKLPNFFRRLFAEGGTARRSRQPGPRRCAAGPALCR